MATVSLPGGPTVNYREWGRPDGAVVLLLHGLTVSGRSWQNVAPCSAKTSGWWHRRAGPRRQRVDARLSFELMRDDVVKFMEQLGILAAIVVGHSMGAVTAYELAATRP
jgi:pimeloyl-ACP methyl ester carboxylesterase